MTLNNPSGRTVFGLTREQALANYYAAERNAGTDPLLANERMHLFAQSIDQLEADLAAIRQCMERK